MGKLISRRKRVRVIFFSFLFGCEFNYIMHNHWQANGKKRKKNMIKHRMISTREFALILVASLFLLFILRHCKYALESLGLD